LFENVPVFYPSSFSEEIRKIRYSFTKEETWLESCSRVASQIVKAELPEKQKTYESKFYELLSKNLFVPGGRIWYNSGRNNPQLLNCFALTDSLDSREGWGNLAKDMIITSMAGGGCGISFSDVRPTGSIINGNGGICPGPESLMQLIDNCAAPVKAGGGRRVALLFGLDIDHPDILSFIDSKITEGKLVNANISVKCKRTTDFVKAVKEDLDWELSWKGKYKKTIKARQIWNKIVENAYNKYHEVLNRLVSKGFSRKRAKESARFYLPYANQLCADIAFNFRSFVHFLRLRYSTHAQLEICNIAKEMLILVNQTGAFKMSLEAFGLTDSSGNICQPFGDLE
jgi:ribonucleotide reductase alpha subunit